MVPDLDALAGELSDFGWFSREACVPDKGKLIAQALAMPPDDIVKLMEVLARNCAGMGVSPDMLKSAGQMFQQLADELPDELLPLVCDYWLRAAHRVDYRYCVGGLIRMASGRQAAGKPVAPEHITLIRRHDPRAAAAFAGPVLNGGEAWSEAALTDAARLGPAWRDLLAHAVMASGAKPSARWESEARAKLAAVGGPAAAGQIRAWLGLVGKPRAGSVPGADDRIDSHDADAVRGLAWMLGMIAADAESARLLARLAEVVLRKIPGIGPRSPKIANAAVHVLSLMPGEDALAQLGRLAARITYRGTLTQLDKALESRAVSLGVTRGQIEELAVPGFGLTEVGRRAEQLGDVNAELVIRGRAVDLTWRTAAGKPAKAPPERVRREFAEEVRELKSAAADVQKMLAAQAGRLDRLFLARRTWDFGRWSEFYLDHPLVGTLARRLIWLVDTVPAIYADGALRTLGGAVLAPEPGTPVELWHPIGREAAEVLAWQEWLEQHQVTQPFKQAHREVYMLTATEQRTRIYSSRFADHVLRQHQFNALAAQRGWRSQLRVEADTMYPPAHRDLPEWDLRAEYWIEGAGPFYQDDPDGSYAFRYVTTDQVRFYPAGSARNLANALGGSYEMEGRGTPAEPVPLAGIPPLVLSEVLRDIDLFVGVASVANDPAWPGDGTDDEYGEYRRSYGLRELSETARTRGSLLQRLLPRLAIGARCTIEGRFLHVRGTLHTYKIHLGSGSVLMSPGDAYLCIVARESSFDGPSSGVALPFEGDSTLAIILSKAMLLANDDKITDPGITSQLCPRS